MRRAGSGIIVCASMVWVLGMAVSASVAQGKQAVRIHGAASLSEWIQTYAELYMKQAPNCGIMVTGTSTGVGVNKLIDGEADLAAVSRKIAPATGNSCNCNFGAYCSRISEIRHCFSAG
jgi:ABC-type phosphate transport system substrate-binding protein